MTDGDTKVLVKICCHTCDGSGVIEEDLYPNREKVRVLCYECDGNGWTLVQGP